MTHKKARRQTGGSRRSLLPIALIGGALVLAVIAIGVGIMSADAGATGSGGKGPQLAVNQDKIDFGNLPFDKTVRAEFKLENKGDRNLTLDVSTPIRVVEGCWPPNPVVGTTTLKPGQATILYAEFMMHQGMDGKHLFDVTVKTNDPQQREKHLFIASNWVPPGK